jgi:phage shock protein A
MLAARKRLARAHESGRGTIIFMGIFDRMGRVISSNVNSLLEKGEDPRKLLELNLDEMGEQLKRGHKDVISAVAEEKRLKKKVEEADADIDKWDKRAELALKAGDETLARDALKQKKRVEGDRTIAEKVRGEQRDIALRMKGDLERMEKKLDELKLRKGTIAARAQQAQAGGGTEALGSRGGDNAFENFRRMESKIEGKEAEVSAMAEVDEALGKGAESEESLEAKFRDLERQVGAGKGDGPDVEDELAALKKRIRV